MYQTNRWVDPALLSRIYDLGGTPQQIGLHKPFNWPSYLFRRNRNTPLTSDVRESRRSVLKRALGLSFPDSRKGRARQTGPFKGYY